MIFFISRFVFHGTRSKFHSRVPLICIYSMNIFGYGPTIQKPAMETVKSDAGSRGCNRAIIKRRSLVISRQTGLMAHKQRSATVH